MDIKRTRDSLAYYYHLLFKQDLEQTIKDSKNRLDNLFSLINVWYGKQEIKSVLDIGAGRFLVYSRLLNEKGILATALDKEFVYEKANFSNWVSSFYHNGFRSGVRDISSDFQNRRTYLRNRIKNNSFPVLRRDLEIPIWDYPFDVTFSVDVLEHINKLSLALRNIKGLTKKITIHEIGLWGSLPGGHDPNWYKLKDPWVHLKDEDYDPPYAFCNRLTSDDFIKQFEMRFTDVRYTWFNYRKDINFERLLGDQQFPDIPRNDLIHTSFIIAGRS